MPTEDDLRDLFANADAPSHHVDPKRVIRASRARRLPKQIAAGGAGALVLAGVTVLGLQSLNLGGGADTVNAPLSYESSDQDSSGTAEDSTLSTKRPALDRLNLCGATPIDFAPSFFGLRLDVTFPASAPASSERIDGIVILTNDSSEPVTGSSLLNPAMTLSQNGVVLWHTNGPSDFVDVRVDLAPGASMELPATFVPVRCDAEDDALEQFRPDLPLVGPGTYDVSAALYFTSDTPTPTTELDLVNSPPAPITLN